MRKKTWKKIIAAALACTMLLSMAACGGSEDGADDSSEKSADNSDETADQDSDEKLYYNTEDFWPICEEPITITVAGQNGSTPDWNETEFVQVVKEKMGIEMVCQQFEEDAWTTQLTLMISSDDLPDIIGGMFTDISEVNNYGADGYLLPINEYLDIMPNFAAYLEENPDYEAVITAADGNIYGLTQNKQNPVALMIRTFINKVWLENLGLEKPTNVDELYEVLKAFKEQDANGNGDPDDEVPLTGNFENLKAFLGWFGIYSDDMKYSPVVDENGTVILGQATENYKAMLKYIKKLYDEGLYDADALVQTEDEMRVKFQEDRAGMTTCGSAPFVLAGQDVSYDQNWYALAGLTSEYSDTSVAVYSSGVTSNTVMAVSAETEYPEAICRFIDYLFTDEGIDAAANGFPGVSTEQKEVAGAEGWYVTQVREDYDEDYPGEYASAEEYRYKKAVPNNVFRLITGYKGTCYELMMTMSEDELYSLEDTDTYRNWGASLALAYRDCEQEVSSFSTLPYTAEESDRRATLKTDISMYIEQAFGQFITGEIDIDAGWDSYISTLEQMGMDELLEIEQGAYDRAYN